MYLPCFATVSTGSGRNQWRGLWAHFREQSPKLCGLKLEFPHRQWDRWPVVMFIYSVIKIDRNFPVKLFLWIIIPSKSPFVTCKTNTSWTALLTKAIISLLEKVYGVTGNWRPDLDCSFRDEMHRILNGMRFLYLCWYSSRYKCYCLAINKVMAGILPNVVLYRALHFYSYITLVITYTYTDICSVSCIKEPPRSTCDQIYF